MSTSGRSRQSRPSARLKSPGGPPQAPFRPFLAKDRVLRKLFDVSDAIVLLIGGRGEKLIDANSQLSSVLGYSKRDFRGSRAYRIFADAQAGKKFLQGVWRTNKVSAVQTHCLHKSGRAVPATIRARLVSRLGVQAALAVIRVRSEARAARERRTEREQLARLLHVSGKTAQSSPNLKREFESWLGRICRVARLPVAHMHVLSKDVAGIAGGPDLWHVTRSRELDPIRSSPDCLALPEEFDSRLALTRSPEVIVDLNSFPQFRRSPVRGLNLKSAFSVPIVVGNEVGAVVEFFSTRSADQDALLIEAIHILGRELGSAIHHRFLAAKLTKLQDEERRRLARELHDTVAQSLSVLLLDLEAVQDEIASLSARAQGALDRAMSLARQSLQEIRTFSYLLHPPVLDALGLLPALRVFIEGFSRRSGIRVTSQLPSAMPRMPDDWEMAVFRVVQEGLTNVQRHSRSPCAEVSLTVASGIAVLRVVNQGSSLPPIERGGIAPENVGVGIGGMRERIRALGGNVNLFSRDDKTILEAIVPVPKSSRSPQLPLRF